MNKYTVNPGLTYAFYREGKEMTFSEGQSFEANPSEVEYGLAIGTLLKEGEDPTTENKKGGK